MSSILTNNSAMVALQTLKSINSQLGKTQADIATGKTVANAKDNAAVWAISKVMETDQSAFKTIQSNLNVGEAVVATARTGAEKVVETLREIKDMAVGAYNTATATEKDKINAEIQLKFKQIASVIAGTQMNGVNLLNEDGGELKVLASLDRGTGATTTANAITVANVGMGAVIDGLDTDSSSATFGTFTGATDADNLWFANAIDTEDGTVVAAGEGIDGFIGRLETAISSALEKTAELGSYGKQISDQASFVGKLGDSLKTGIGALVDADMEEASARLQALQTQQQLGIQALSIANQGPSAVMSLFR